MKKKIQGVAFSDLTKEIYDSFGSILNTSESLMAIKDN